MQEERVCHFRKLSLHPNGKIFPCCFPPKETFVANAFQEKDIFKAIEEKDIICECPLFKSRKKKEGEKPDIKYIHLVLSNYCQANCVCCMQDKEEKFDMKKVYESDKKIINHYKPEHIIAIGGEVLVQPEAMEMLAEIKQQNPKISIETITNLCVSKEKLQKAIEIFDVMTISFLGFTKNTYNREMRLDFERTLENFEHIYENTKIKLRPKYLATPTNLLELPLFLENFIKKDVEKIYLHNIMEFREVATLNHKYWKNSFSLIKKDMIKLLEQNKKEKNIPISIHEVLAEMLELENSELVTVTR